MRIFAKFKNIFFYKILETLTLMKFSYFKLSFGFRIFRKFPKIKIFAKFKNIFRKKKN